METWERLLQRTRRSQRKRIVNQLKENATILSMKIYLLCPYVKNNRSYSIHQLCSYINALGREGYILYAPNPDNQFLNLYPEIPRVKIQPVVTVEDIPENMLIVPDIYHVSTIRNQCKSIRYAVWWLSGSVVSDLEQVFTQLQGVSMVHLFPTYFAYVTIRPLLPVGTKVFFLGDNVADEFIVSTPDISKMEKQDLVAYSGSMDQMSALLCEAANIKCVDVSMLRIEDRISVYQKAKVFTNFGYYLGKDRFMREAAVSGCVVVTHKSGAAGYKEDVPIDEKVGFDTEVPLMIANIFNNFESYYVKQDGLRSMVKSEKTDNIVKTQLFLETIAM